jgi:hypothetical protein
MYKSLKKIFTLLIITILCLMINMCVNKEQFDDETNLVKEVKKLSKEAEYAIEETGLAKAAVKKALEDAASLAAEHASASASKAKAAAAEALKISKKIQKMSNNNRAKVKANEAISAIKSTREQLKIAINNNALVYTANSKKSVVSAKLSVNIAKDAEVIAKSVLNTLNQFKQENNKQGSRGGRSKQMIL